MSGTPDGHPNERLRYSQSLVGPAGVLPLQRFSGNQIASPSPGCDPGDVPMGRFLDPPHSGSAIRERFHPGSGKRGGTDVHHTLQHHPGHRGRHCRGSRRFCHLWLRQGMGKRIPGSIVPVRDGANARGVAFDHPASGVPWSRAIIEPDRNQDEIVLRLSFRPPR
jgi:hypothetical protein